jgi:hypothetical protein
MGEQITCTGRQYLRQMTKFFMARGYEPLVMDTDGINFSAPKGVEDRVYIGRGSNWKVKQGKEYKGAAADIAEYNDIFMRGEMALDNDGVWPSCINIARKNYALLTEKGKIKLVGNTIKSKKLPGYIEDFLDKGIKLLLQGKGKDFVEFYYEYLTKIYNKEITLVKIAQRGKIKQSVKEYEERCKQKTKAGNLMSRQAHMELVIRNNMNVNLGDVIYYVNNGTKISQGDVAKKGDTITLNCYLVSQNDIDNNPNLTGEYNVPRAISVFNKRIEPLLVVFKPEVREVLLITDPEKREYFTTLQCELINGQPFSETDQDSLEKDVLEITEQEIDYWKRRGLNPNYIYELAESGWENHIDHQSLTPSEESMYQF